MTIDDETDTSASPDCEITGNGQVRVLVIAAREEVEIARKVRTALPEMASATGAFGEASRRQCQR